MLCSAAFHQVWLGSRSLQPFSDKPSLKGCILKDTMHAGPKGGFDVVRYHSLAVEEQSLPACLQPIAWTCGGHHAVVRPALSSSAIQLQHPPLSCGNGLQLPADRVLMALAHRDRPHYGVQFHPESIATAFGHVLIENFMQLTLQHRRTHRNGYAAPADFLDSHEHGTPQLSLSFPSVLIRTNDLCCLCNSLTIALRNVCRCWSCPDANPA